jgi:hypothetical protein
MPGSSRILLAVHTGIPLQESVMPRHPLFLPMVLLVATIAAGCDQQPTLPSDATVQSSNAREAAPNIPDFDPRDFVPVVDNRYFPLRPGSRFVYVGTEDGERERVITDVTHRQKTILGVKVVVVLDRVFLDGALAEKTLDWYAQDKKGNVWYLGEDSKEYENGKVVSTAGSWEAGKHGARPGIIMLAHPHVGQSYQQEFALGVAEDRARVLSLQTSVSVPYGSFKHCLKTAETTPLEPGAREIKLYCRGVGFVKGDDVSGGTAHVVLTRIIH